MIDRREMIPVDVIFTIVARQLYEDKGQHTQLNHEHLISAHLPEPKRQVVYSDRSKSYVRSKVVVSNRPVNIIQTCRSRVDVHRLTIRRHRNALERTESLGNQDINLEKFKHRTWLYSLNTGQSRLQGG